MSRMLFPFILTLGFFLLLEFLFLRPETLGWVGPLAFFVYVLILYVASHNWSAAILVNMLLISSFFFLPNAPSGNVKHVFLTLLSILFFAITYELRKILRRPLPEDEKEITIPSHEIVHMLSFAVLFVWFAGLYNLFLANLSHLYGKEIVPIFTVITIILVAGVYVHVMITIPSSPQKTLYAFVVSVILAEAAWAVAFLPFSYLTLGALLLMLYYILWDILQHHLAFSLTKSVVVRNCIFFIFGTGVLLWFTPWVPR